MEMMEARVGIEPTHKGFADLSLTTWVPRLGWAVMFPERELVKPAQLSGECIADELCMERETGVEPATSSLARKHSTTELLPLTDTEYNGTSYRGSTRRA